jgi:DNA-binding CsgD family transcriptional regulator
MDLNVFPEQDSGGSGGIPRRPDGPPGLIHEHEELQRVFRAARDGDGQAIVVRGRSGLGKTTLLDHAIGSIPTLSAVQVAGLDAERDLAFAGLHRLCAPMLASLDRLPAPQRDALGTALGVHPGDQVDLLFLGLAVLGLLADLSADRPLVCAVDDADRLDVPSLRVLAFVARRLRTERIALVFTVTEPVDDLAGLPELVLRPLTPTEGRALLASAVPGPLDTEVRDRIVAESGGNRRALLGPPGMKAEQLAGGFGLPATPPPPDATTSGLRERLESLPARTRRFMLVAAAEPQGDAAVIWRAAALLDIDRASAEEATLLGLLHLGRRVTFGDMRVRSVVYHDAPLDERRRIHGALATASDAEADPDRRAWHRGLAALVPDEAVASGLARAATRVVHRGGIAASAALLERSARLAPEGSRRVQRALAAARAKFDVGSVAAASELVTVASEGPLDELGRARLMLLRAQLAFARRRHGDASELLLEASAALAPVDAALARDAYLEALEAAILSDRPDLARRVAHAVNATGSASVGSDGVAELLLDALVELVAKGRAAAVPKLRRAVRAACDEREPRWLGLASRVAAALWDDEAALALASRRVRMARDTGALVCWSAALDDLARLHMQLGDVEAAAGLIDEARTISEAIGRRPAAGAAMLAAWRGAEAEVSRLLDRSPANPLTANDDRAVAHAATAVLSNGLGHYQDALVAARRACQYDELASPVALPELVEGAARGGEQGIAVEAFERLAEQTQMSRTEWALGIEARAHALISDGDSAEKHYCGAIEHLARCRAVSHLARAHLLYGEWLRRERRRVDARAELRTAHELFSGMGAAAFAARAEHELVATGVRERRRTVDAAGALTPREAQVAHLARDGRSNPQIGTQLFISARTVEYHLHKVFTKLGIESRRQLALALN